VRWHTRENSGIRLDRQGRWWHDGAPVEHPRIVEAFNRGLAPNGDGRFRLNFGGDWCLVEVEDAAYWVQAAVASAEQLTLTLSDGTDEALAPDTLWLEPDGVLACQVKNGQAKARFGRQAQASLGEHLVEEGGAFALALPGRRVPLPSLKAMS